MDAATAKLFAWACDSANNAYANIAASQSDLGANAAEKSTEALKTFTGFLKFAEIFITKTASNGEQIYAYTSFAYKIITNAATASAALDVIV